MIHHWIDLRNGDLLVGVDAYEVRMNEAPAYSDEIRPLAEVLCAKDFDIDQGSIEPYPKVRRLNEEECRAQGAWVLNVIRQIEPKASITHTHLQRAHQLGLTANHRTIVAHTGGSIWALREKLNAPRFAPFGSYSDWTIDQFVDNARLLARKLHRQPQLHDFREWARDGNGPSERAIIEFFPGRMRALSEQLGKPDIRSWEEDDYVDWGVRFMEANDGLLPTVITSRIIARHKLGPTHRTIHINFPGGYKTFKERVVTSYNLKLSDYASRIADNQQEIDDLATLIPEHSIGTSSTPLELLARYQVIRECLKGLTSTAAAQLALASQKRNLIEVIQSKDSSMSAGRIELIAVGLDWYDELWPPYPDDAKRLKISKSELNAEKRRAALEAKRMREKLKQRQRARVEKESPAA